MCSKWLLYVDFLSRDFESPFLLLNNPSLLVNTSSPEYESAFISGKLVCILIPICDLQSAFQIDPCCPLCFSFLSQRVGEHVVPGVVVWSFSLVKVWAAWSDVSKYIESTKIMSLLASLAIPLAPAVPTVDSATR